jgi:phage gpG-like protein
MLNLNNYSFLSILLIVTLLNSCETETETQFNNNINKIQVSTMTVYTGNDVNNLEKKEYYVFKYNSDGNILSKLKNVYENSELVGSDHSDYAYIGNTVIESSIINFGGPKTSIDKTYINLNSNKLISSDSSCDMLNSNSPAVVRRRIYQTHSKVSHKYTKDTMDAQVFHWHNGNLTKEYEMNGLMGRVLIMSYNYGTKANTLNTGDFWNNGMKSANLPESATEPNNEYKYTYKIESDGFISEELMSVSSPSGLPYRYEKKVYTR